MSTYALGDIQGCYRELRNLLKSCGYSPHRDQLWFVGDLVNRGPDNLDTMRFIMDVPDAIVVLGNHDLHFLAVATGTREAHDSDTLNDLLEASDLEIIVHWLRQQPLLHVDPDLGYTMVHAGLPPQWNLETCIARSNEVSAMLKSDRYIDFFNGMYGNEPARWNDSLTGMDRLRLITNYFTRLRYCTPTGELELKHKTDIRPQGFSPWFEVRSAIDDPVIFGHWAALNGVTDSPHYIGLDTGCVWGRTMTAMRLEDRRLFTTPSLSPYDDS